VLAAASAGVAVVDGIVVIVVGIASLMLLFVFHRRS
jgi:hypothetical protein